MIIPPAQDNASFYENLANFPAWRYPCHNCSCPRWAHARDNNGVATVGPWGCACGKCSRYARRKQEVMPKVQDREAMGE